MLSTLLSKAVQKAQELPEAIQDERRTGRAVY